MLEMPLILQQKQEVAVSEVTSHLKLKNRAFLGEKKASFFVSSDGCTTEYCCCGFCRGGRTG